MGEQPSTTSGSDRVAGLLVVAALALACGLFALVGFVLPFFTVSCGVASTTCHAGLVALGTAVASVVPWILTVAGTIGVAGRVRHGEPLGGVPWAWLSGAVIIAAIGVGVVFLGGGFGL